MQVQIESRPQKKHPLRVVDDSNKGSARYFDYLFYIDFEASMVEPHAQYALGHLQDVYMYFRGSGKAAEMKREAAKRTMMAAVPSFTKILWFDNAEKNRNHSLFFCTCA
ncbi:unnamed protein product [Camellia sinensis]